MSFDPDVYREAEKNLHVGGWIPGPADPIPTGDVGCWVTNDTAEPIAVRTPDQVTVWAREVGEYQRNPDYDAGGLVFRYRSRDDLATAGDRCADPDCYECERDHRREH